MKQVLLIVLLFASGSCFSQTPPASGGNEDPLRSQANAARAKGDLQGEADAWCRAATLDAAKYAKKCEHTRADANKGLAQFQADIEMARNELQQKDYLGALRDLAKITYGPHFPEAQALMEQTRLSMGGPASEQANRELWEAARAAYAQGDFAAAQSKASRVQSAQLRPLAEQMLTNIRVYNLTMQQADALARNHDFHGAAQKYAFAAQIKPDGPGAPHQQLQQMQVAELNAAPAHAQAGPQSPVAAPAASASPSQETHVDQRKLQSMLVAAKRSEASGNLKVALQSYDAVLHSDGGQKEALAGKARVLDAMKNDPQALEATIRSSVTHFYSSDFEQAEDEAQAYLQGGGRSYVGAAHFYLGACLESRSLLMSPATTDPDQLLEKAKAEFLLARQAHYQPVEKLISPRILMTWTQTAQVP
jgi:hypothetical protein